MRECGNERVDNREVWELAIAECVKEPLVHSRNRPFPFVHSRSPTLPHFTIVHSRSPTFPHFRIAKSV